MADGLDVVSVGVEHERSVVPGVVVLTQPRGAVVDAAGGDRRGVEGVDGGALLAVERDVWVPVPAGGRSTIQKVGLPWTPKPAPRPNCIWTVMPSGASACS